MCAGGGGHWCPLCVIRHVDAAGGAVASPVGLCGGLCAAWHRLPMCALECITHNVSCKREVSR